MEAAAQTEPNTSSLLMLDEPRVIAMRDGKHSYAFHFRRITQPDWERYFSGLYVASQTDAGMQTNTTDLQTAGIELFESTLTKVCGYKRELTSKEDFKKILPRHSMNVSWLLHHVFASAAEGEEPLDCDSVETRIDALWSQTNPGDETTMFKGLVHRFSSPTIEQKKKYLRSGSISRVIGGSRNGMTIHSLRNKVMLDLYDQLIQSVQGYGVNGKPLETVEAIRKEMDAYHKVEAVGRLFIPQPDVQVEAAA